jgi:hypothetical protein
MDIQLMTKIHFEQGDHFCFTNNEQEVSYIGSTFISEVLCSSFLWANDHNVPGLSAPIVSWGGR